CCCILSGVTLTRHWAAFFVSAVLASVRPGKPDCCILTTAATNSAECTGCNLPFAKFCQRVSAILSKSRPIKARQMAKPKHTMVPRRPAVLLALLASASHQTLLAAVTVGTVGSLNVGLLSSASAATCVTGVTPTFANVVSGVSGTPGQTVVTSVTPTMAAA